MPEKRKACAGMIRGDAKRVSFFGSRSGIGFGAPAARTAFEQMAMMQQAVEQGADGRGVAQQLAPVLDGAVGSDQAGSAFIATHDDLQQILGRGEWELAHAQVIEDEQGHGGEEFHALLACLIESGVGQLFQQTMGLAIQDAIALLDRGLADGLSEMRFSAAGRT